MNTNDKSAESNAKDENTKRDFSTLSHIIKCYNCQGYGMLLPTVQLYLRLPSLTEFSLRPLSLIVLSLWKSLLWLRRLMMLPRLSRLLSLLLLLQQLPSVFFFLGSTVDTTFSTSFTADLYCRYLFHFSSIADTIPFPLVACVRFKIEILHCHPTCLWFSLKS